MDEPKINEKYRGNEAVAVTQFKGMYNLKMESSSQELSDRLISENKFIDFKVLARYDSINVDAANKIYKAWESLEKGEKVDFKTLLEN